MKPKLMFYIMLGALIASLVGGGVGFYFSLQELDKNVGDIAVAKAEKEVAEQDIIQSKSLAATYQELKGDLPDLEEVLPDNKAQDDSIIRLYALAEAAEVDIEPIGILASPEPGEYSQLELIPGKTGVLAQQFNISFTTDRYSQLIKFIEAIENSERYMMFSDMRIASNGTSLSSINAGILVFSKGSIPAPKPVVTDDKAATEEAK